MSHQETCAQSHLALPRYASGEPSGKFTTHITIDNNHADSPIHASLEFAVLAAVHNPDLPLADADINEALRWTLRPPR